MRPFRQAGFVLAALQTAIGVAMVSVAIANGGGPLAVGVILGTLLAAFGILRGYLHVKAAQGVGARRG